MRARTISRWLLCALGASAGLPRTARAEPFALDRFSPAPAGDRMYGVQSPFAAGHQEAHATALLDYAHNPLILKKNSDDEEIGAVVSHQLFLHLNGSIAIWQRVNFSLELPVALYQAGESPQPDQAPIFASPSSAAFGDLRVGLRVRLFGDYFDKVQVAIGGYLWVPTGKNEPGSFVTDGSVRGQPQLIAGGRGDRVVWAAAVGPEFRPGVTFAHTPLGMGIQGGAGAGYLFGDERRLQIGLEASGGTTLGDPDRRNTNLEVLASARYRIFSPIEIGLGVGPGLLGGIGTPDFRGVFSIGYTAEQKKPEERPPAPVAPPDRDNDGIIDAEDACPDAPGLRSPDPKANGCPPPKDTDKDGILDDNDACVNDPGPANMDPKKNGCPPPSDRDKDGVADAEDACPDVPGEFYMDPKRDGCPPDKDRDNVPDKEDACVDIPGLKTSDPKTNGCPGDTDGDSIRDDRDACPNEKGKPSPDPKKNGCPLAVRVTEGEIVILQQVQFDTSRATIRKVSDPLLDEVAGVLKEHPEITKIEVQGHTDNRGSAEVNEKLSQDRATAVMKALLKRGIEAKRLTAKGYGQNVPIAANLTSAGRQKNRRVEFKILERKPKPPPPN